MSALSRFITTGARIFIPGRTYGRLPFQPVLYLFLWAAAVRIYVGDDAIADIPFRASLGPWSQNMWHILSIGSPPLALLGWYLIVHRPARAKLAGHWLRLSADIGMFISLLSYHIATAIGANGWRDDSTIYSRYLTAACIAFTFGLVVRDAWILLVIDRLAAGIRDGRYE